MGYIGSDPVRNDSVSTAQLADDAVTSPKIVDDIVFTNVTASNNVSASGTVQATSFQGIFEGALSSSAQIATNISGSFTAASSSFSTRVTRNEASASSLTTASSSFSSRLDNSEASGALMNQDLKTSASPTFTGGTYTSNLGVSGSLTVKGMVTAEEFHTEFVSASIVYKSGSTKFGDDIDDTHSFTGSINQSGSFNLNDGNMSVTDTLTATTLTGTTIKDFSTISGSSTSTGSFGNVVASKKLIVNNTVPAEGLESTAVLSTVNFPNQRNDLVIDTYDDGGESSTLWFRKSDSDTIGTKAQTDGGDILGTIYFQGIDSGGNRDYGAYIAVTQTGSAAARVPAEIAFGTSDGTNIPERMRIDKDGNVGIGTTSPGSSHAKANKLVVGGGSACGIGLHCGTAEGWYAFARNNSNDSDAYDGGMSYSSRELKFHTNAGATRLTIGSGGDATFAGKIKGANGSAGSPEFTFTNNADSGMYSPADNQLGLASGGTLALIFGGDQSATFYGDVGMGATSAFPLTLTSNSTDVTGIRLTNTSTNGHIWNITSGGTGHAVAGGLDFYDDTVNEHRMVIDSSGNVGIGTTSPGMKLDIQGETGNINKAQARIYSPASAYNATGLEVIATGTDGDQTGINIAVTGSADTNVGMKIASSGGGTNNYGLLVTAGNVGIGHDTPQYGLTLAQGSADSSKIGWEDAGNTKRASIVGNSSTDDLEFRIGASDTLAMSIEPAGRVKIDTNAQWNMALYREGTGGSAGMIEFYRNSVGVGSIQCTSSGTSYIESSDYRLKENEVAISDGITRLKQLKPYRFNFKVAPDKTVDGFFAHEVSSVVPQAITGEKDAIDENDEIIAQGIDHSKLVPLLVSALQEAIDRIEALENA